MDHFHQIPFAGKPEEPILESWTTISVLAGITSKIKLGTMMTGSVTKIQMASMTYILTFMYIISYSFAFSSHYHKRDRAFHLASPTNLFFRDVITLTFSRFSENSSLTAYSVGLFFLILSQSFPILLINFIGKLGLVV